jgi:hypothetical protein
LTAARRSFSTVFFAAVTFGDQRIYTLARTVTYKYVDVNGKIPPARRRLCRNKSVARRSSDMRTKYQALLVAILALVAQTLSDNRLLAQDKRKQGDAPIQTDEKIYKVTVTPQSVKFVINYSYENRSGDFVFLPTCVRPYRPLLEKKVEGRWVSAAESFERMCVGPPVQIEPGKKYQDSFQVEAFLPGNNIIPKLKVDVREIEGVYRLVHVFETRDHQRLPLKDRVSNEFKLTK